MSLGLRIVASVAIFNVAIAARSELPSFASFVQRYGRSYDAAEYKERSALFERMSEAARRQNARPERLWTAGVNKLWDWTDAEFQKLRGWDGSLRPDGGRASVAAHGTFLQTKMDLPTEKIWNQLTTSRRVKDQGSCGSCWAIASSTVLEAHTEIHTGSNRTFSTQQLVSCTPNPRRCGGDGGCKGATAELAMAYVMQHGLLEESAVPYMARDEPCLDVGSPTVAMAQVFGAAPQKSPAMAFGMKGWETLPLNKYEPLVRALAERGPVAVSVSASPWAMYDAGIFNGCPKDAIIDHAVTAVGYGAEKGVKYWVIQNSWGEDWGEEGLIRLFRHDADEYCGMNTKPQLGVGCAGETDPVPVCGMCGVLFDSVVPHF